MDVSGFGHVLQYALRVYGLFKGYVFHVLGIFGWREIAVGHSQSIVSAELSRRPVFQLPFGKLAFQNLVYLLRSLDSLIERWCPQTRDGNTLSKELVSFRCRPGTSSVPPSAVVE